ncbi:MAG: hypothetical protein JO189_03240, partial [Deltaproteobacteria bacterium]|nr:hypothetical protein [Deltaproteobacteria bacterium]
MIRAATMIIVVAAWATLSWAQLPLPGGPSCGTTPANPCFVVDTPGPFDAGPLDTTDFFYLITESLTTPETNQNFTPINDYLSGLVTVMNQNVSPDDFEGWEPLSDTSTEDAATITDDTLGTYKTALSTAQSVAASSANDGFTQIETSSQTTPYVLAALQANTEAVLALGQQVQLGNQLLASLVAVEAIHHMQELDAVARMQASQADYFTAESTQQALAPAKLTFGSL